MPVIGIGAGADVDGQILVLYDILDIWPGKRTRFSKNYMQLAGSIQGAVESYYNEVKQVVFSNRGVRVRLGYGPYGEHRNE